MSNQPSDDLKAEHTKVEMMYLVLEQIRRGPREYASAFGFTYVTRAVCTSESTATTLQTNLSDDEPDGTFVLLKLPPDQTFPAGLPPGAEPPSPRNYKSKSYPIVDDTVADGMVSSHPRHHRSENLSVSPETYQRDRMIREAEIMQRFNVQKIPAEKHTGTHHG